PKPGRTPFQDSALDRAVQQKAMVVTAMMFRAGVRLLAGTDTGYPYVLPGFGLHDELELMVSAGLPVPAVLRIATLAPAQFFGREDELGSVSRGKLADLVLLDANPLESIANTRRVRAVVADGRLYDRAALDRLLADEAAAGTYRAAPAAGTYRAAAAAPTHHAVPAAGTYRAADAAGT